MASACNLFTTYVIKLSRNVHHTTGIRSLTTLHEPLLHTIVRWCTNSLTYLETLTSTSPSRPASWSSGQSFWLLVMKYRFRFPALPWGFFLEVKYAHGDHGLGSLVELRLRPLLVLHIHISPSISSGQRNCASWASQPGWETTNSIRD
jgi:hypothetical protein